jgi:hypothetical protein
MVKRGRLGGISETPLLFLRGSSVSGMYACKNEKKGVAMFRRLVVVPGAVGVDP